MQTNHSYKAKGLAVPLHGSSLQVLIVEDDVRMQKILYRLFSQQGYGVHCVGMVRRA